MAPVKTGDLQDAGGRDRSGRFARGRSGNPRGRPRGSRNRTTLAVQQLLDGDAEAITRKAIAMAKKGDGVALRLCIERLVPRRERQIQIDLPALRHAEDVAEAARVVIEEAAAGHLTLAEAREFLQLLELQRKALETSDLALRLELLERQTPTERKEEE